MSGNLKLISLNLEVDLLEQIKTQVSDLNMSDFIRRAIKNELDGNHDSAREFNGMMKKIAELDTSTVLEKSFDLEITMHALFEELIKQNEMLKVMYRRITVGTEVIKAGVIEQKGQEFTLEIQNYVFEKVKQELSELNLKGNN